MTEHPPGWAGMKTMAKVIIEFRRRSQIFSMRAFGVMCLQVYRASRMGKGSCHWEPWWEVADPVHLEMGR